MLWLLATLLITTTIQVNGRILPELSSFTKELTFQDKRIILSSSPSVVTENESFLYATCDSQEKMFKSTSCNVTLETPAFINASYVDRCTIKIAVDNRNIESATKLRIYPFNDDKVLISWLIKTEDYRTKVAKIRILHTHNCQYQDISLSAEKIVSLIPYNENNFDAIVIGKTVCAGSESCRIEYNSEGKKIKGPTQFLSNFKFTHLESLVPGTPGTPSKGFRVLALNGKDEGYHVLQVTSNDGKATELFKTNGSNIVKTSNAHEAYSVCWTSGRTNVTCRQYDNGIKLIPKVNVTLEFADEPGYGNVRWIQPHNLQQGGLLLVTGHASGKNNQRFDNFSVFKIRPDGKRERPLIVNALDFECVNIGQLFVNVSENDEDEICFHFVCDRSEFNHEGILSTLKLSTKCLPKKHVSILKHRASIVN